MLHKKELILETKITSEKITKANYYILITA